MAMSILIAANLARPTNRAVPSLPFDPLANGRAKARWPISAQVVRPVHLNLPDNGCSSTM